MQLTRRIIEKYVCLIENDESDQEYVYNTTRRGLGYLLLNDAFKREFTMRSGFRNLYDYIAYDTFNAPLGFTEDDFKIDIQLVEQVEKSGDINRRALRLAQRLELDDDRYMARQIAMYMNQFLEKVIKELKVENREGRNVIAQIYRINPNAICDRKLLKAFLLDFLPEDKLLRNVICLSYDEDIPQEILEIKEIDSIQKQRLTKKLIDAYSVSNDIANKVICLWIEALKNEQIYEGSLNILESEKPVSYCGLNRSAFWGRYSFENVQIIRCSNIVVMDTGKYCIVESINPEGPAYIFEKDVYAEKIEYWLNNHDNNECRNKLWNFRHLARKVFLSQDKQHPEIMDKYIVDNWIANHIM